MKKEKLISANKNKDTSQSSCILCGKYGTYCTRISGWFHCPDCHNFFVDLDESVSVEDMGVISFEKKSYPTRILSIPEEEPVLISVRKLNELLVKDGTFVSTEAESIDNTIFFYVEDKEIGLSENELVNIIQSNI